MGRDLASRGDELLVKAISGARSWPRTTSRRGSPPRTAMACRPSSRQRLCAASIRERGAGAFVLSAGPVSVAREVVSGPSGGRRAASHLRTCSRERPGGFGTAACGPGAPERPAEGFWAFGAPVGAVRRRRLLVLAPPGPRSCLRRAPVCSWELREPAAAGRGRDGVVATPRGCPSGRRATAGLFWPFRAWFWPRITVAPRSTARMSSFELPGRPRAAAGPLERPGGAARTFGSA